MDETSLSYRMPGIGQVGGAALHVISPAEGGGTIV